MKNLIIISIFINIILIPQIAFSVKFDELDKPPEGAHQGQMLLGAFVSMVFAWLLKRKDLKTEV